MLIVRGGKIVRNPNNNVVPESAAEMPVDNHQDPGAASRPQRQCTTRSLSYKFVDQNSDDEE